MEKIYLKQLAKDINTRIVTLRHWVDRYTITKYVFYDTANMVRPKVCIKGCKDFYIKFSEFLATRHDKKYLTNFQEKYNYLLDK